MQRHRGIQIAIIDISVDTAVRIAGQVGDHAAPGRGLVEPRDRHDREHLLDGPDIGHRFEHREVHEILVDQPFGQFVQHRAVVFLVVGESGPHAVRDGVEKIIQARALAQVELAQGVQVQAFGLVVLGLVEQFLGRALAECGVHFAQVADHGRFVVFRWRHRALRRGLHFRDVGHQHRMVRGQGAAGFGQHARRRQAVHGAGFGQRLHDGGGVLGQAVVDRAEAARARAFVVHAEAAAHVHVADRAAGARDFDEIAHRFAHAVGDVAHIGNLAAHVEVQQLQAIQQIGVAQLRDQVQQLARRKPELGLVAAGVLPFAGAQRGQPHAHAEAGLDAQRARFLDHQRQLGGLLDDDEGVEAELAADQRQADVFAVLVAVADDRAARARERQHRHQFGLGAGFKAETFTGVARQFAGHAAVLVDLDRIDRGVAAGVVQVFHGLRERALQAPEAVPEDVGKTQQQRQFQALRQRRVDGLGQGDVRALRAVWTDGDAAVCIDVEIAFAPVGDGIGAAGRVDGPGTHGRAEPVNGRQMVTRRACMEAPDGVAGAAVAAETPAPPGQTGTVGNGPVRAAGACAAAFGYNPPALQPLSPFFAETQ